MSNKPFVFCHMIMSIDGKTTGNFLFEDCFGKVIDEYFEIHQDYYKNKGYNAFCVGKSTSIGSLNAKLEGQIDIDLSKYSDTSNISYDKDFIGKYDEKYFAILPDRKGTLFFKDSTVKNHRFKVYEGAHIIIVTSEQASKSYLAYLQSVGISYIIAGKDDIDINLMLVKLQKNFPIEKLSLEGGPTINTSFFKAGAINQISIMLLPITGETNDKSFFAESYIQHFKLLKAEKMPTNYVWLIYEKI